MTPDDGLERRLGAALHQRLDRMGTAGDLVDGAVTRSRHIRRVRVAGTAAAALVAALAIATPIAWSSLRDPHPGPLPATTSSTATSPTTSPSSTPSTPPTTTPAPTVTLGDPLRTVVPSLDAQASPPDVPYLHGTTVHDGDRAVRLPLKAGTPFSFVGLFADGTVLASVLDVPSPGAVGVWDLVWYDAKGSEIARAAEGAMPVLDSARTQVAWIDARERVHLSDSRGRQVATWPRTGLFPTGVADGRVYANDTSQRGVVLDSSGGAITSTPGTRWGPVLGSAGLAIARQPGPDATRSCFRLVDLRTGSTRWTACGDVDPSGPFSPDGRYLVATGGLDGDPQHEFTVLRVLDGQPVLSIGAIGTPFALDSGKAVNAEGTAVTMVATSVGDVGQTSHQAMLRCPLGGGACTVVGANEAMGTDSSGNPAPAWGLAVP